VASTTITADIIAREACMILDNELVMAKQVFRGYENEYDKRINGYQIGDTLSIRKPTDFTVRSGATAAVQDTIEGKVQITLSNLKGVDFRFSSTDLTLKIDDLSDRIIKPAMVQLANQIDADLMALYAKVPQWVGTAGQTINSFNDYALGPQQLDQFAVPQDSRSSVLSPADYWGMLGSQTALYMQANANDAYRNRNLGMIGGVDTYMAQNVPGFTTGSRTGATTSIGASITSSTITYDTAKNLNGGLTQQTISVANLGGATVTVAAGDVFTITGVFAVNPVTKAKQPFLKQFTVVTAATASGAAITNLVIQPAMIWSGAFQNISTTQTDLNTLTLAWVGSASTVYPQNMVFHKNAFALCSVPLVSPPGAVDVSRQSYKGTNVRVIPYYDGTNDISSWRLDVLYGVQAIDPRLATRLSGT
jgi:hypothetical protein